MGDVGTLGWDVGTGLNGWLISSGGLALRYQPAGGGSGIMGMEGREGTGTMRRWGWYHGEDEGGYGIHFKAPFACRVSPRIRNGSANSKRPSSDVTWRQCKLANVTRTPGQIKIDKTSQSCTYLPIHAYYNNNLTRLPRQINICGIALYDCVDGLVGVHKRTSKKKHFPCD